MATATNERGSMLPPAQSLTFGPFLTLNELPLVSQGTNEPKSQDLHFVKPRCGSGR